MEDYIKTPKNQTYHAELLEKIPFRDTVVHKNKKEKKVKLTGGGELGKILTIRRDCPVVAGRTIARGWGCL